SGHYRYRMMTGLILHKIRSFRPEFVQTWPLPKWAICSSGVGPQLQSSLRYNPAFDGMRAIAAMLVIASHCRVPGFNPGYFGVDLFFVLSGFLITRLLTEEREARGQID